MRSPSASAARSWSASDSAAPVHHHAMAMGTLDASATTTPRCSVSPSRRRSPAPWAWVRIGSSPKIIPSPAPCQTATRSPGRQHRRRLAHAHATEHGHVHQFQETLKLGRATAPPSAAIGDLPGPAPVMFHGGHCASSTSSTPGRLPGPTRPTTAPRGPQAGRPRTRRPGTHPGVPVPPAPAGRHPTRPDRARRLRGVPLRRRLRPPRGDARSLPAAARDKLKVDAQTRPPSRRGPGVGVARDQRRRTPKGGRRSPLARAHGNRRRRPPGSRGQRRKPDRPRAASRATEPPTVGVDAHTGSSSRGTPMAWASAAASRARGARTSPTQAGAREKSGSSPITRPGPPLDRVGRGRPRRARLAAADAAPAMDQGGTTRRTCRARPSRLARRFAEIDPAARVAASRCCLRHHDARRGRAPWRRDGTDAATQRGLGSMRPGEPGQIKMAVAVRAQIC